MTACDPGFAFARAAQGVQADEDRLPFADGAFDLVVSVGVLDSVNDLPGALLLIRRSLRPDGLFMGAFAGAGSLPRLKRAMLEVMERYLQDLNDGSDARAGQEPARRDAAQPGADLRLHWELHVWTLGGTAQARRAQLQSYYAQQPVFALVGGLTTDTWLPVHEFCQQQKVPCLFPNTSLPVSGVAAFYAVYFDKGSVLKAQILARYFADHAKEFSSGRIVQVLPGNWSGYEPAAALRQAMGRVKAHRVIDQVVEPGTPTPPEFWRQVLGRRLPAR